MAKRKQKLEQGSVVLVQWEDAMLESMTQFSGDTPLPGFEILDTVGFLVREEPDKIGVAQDRARAPYGGFEYRTLMTIPKKLVRKIICLADAIDLPEEEGE